MIRAILRAQALSMRMAARRGPAVSLGIGLLWLAFWVTIAVAVFAAAASANAGQLQAYTGLALLAAFIYWQVVPVITATLGSSLDLHKLLIYPIPHQKLFGIEVLLRITSGGEALLVTAGGAAGLLFNPARVSTAPRVLAAWLLFVAFNLLLAAGARSLLERLLARPRVREVLTVGMLLVWVVPRLAMSTHYSPAWLGGGALVLRAAIWPWGAVETLMLSAAGPAALAVVTLLAWVFAAAWFGFTQFERGLRFDADAAEAGPLARGARTAGIVERFYSLPRFLFRDPMAAMVEKELRSLARSPRFRTIFTMGFTFGIAVWMPMALGRPDRTSVDTYFLTLVSIYAFMLLGQVSYLNCFGLDRAGAQIYFAVPHKLSTALVAKNLACGMYLYLEVLLLSAITATLGMVAGWAVFLENAIVVGVAAAYLMALGNLSSVYYPRALKPERVGRGGASSRFQALVFLLYPIALAPVAAAYVVRSISGSELLFGLVLAVAAVIGGVVYGVALDSAAHAAKRLRETMIAELSRSEGPVEAD